MALNNQYRLNAIEDAANKNSVRIGSNKEIKRLPYILDDTENVIGILTCSHEGKSGRGVIVATEKRVLFLLDNDGKDDLQSFDYKNLSSITFKKNILLGSLTITADHRIEKYNGVSPKYGNQFVELVCELITDYMEENATKSNTNITKEPKNPPTNSMETIPED